MNSFRTSTFQLTVLYAVMLAISTVALAAFLYWSTIGFLQRQTDSTIDVEITGLREQYRVLGLDGLNRVIGNRIRSGDDPEALYLFADRSLRPLAGNMTRWPDLVSREDGWYSFAHSRDGRETAARARVLALPEGLVLLVGREVSDFDQLLSLVIKAFAWGSGLVIILALAGGLFMSNQVLKRIESINSTTRSIVTGDLHQRVPTRGTQDEFDQLAGNLNRMLDQIERLMGGIRHVGDSIAHDLRTPLTRLRHSLEEATRSDNIDAMRVDLQAAIDDADGLLSTFSALLRIARLESGSYLERKESVVLATLVRDAIELYEAVADERKLDVSSDVECKDEIPGDRDLIFQLVVNLLDNALKYTPEGGKIHLSVHRDGDLLVLTVTDTGPGIAADQIDKITARFYRIDPSRQLPGSGLGLALVQAVADHHGASLAFSDNAPGLRAQVSFHL